MIAMHLFARRVGHHKKTPCRCPARPMFVILGVFWGVIGWSTPAVAFSWLAGFVSPDAATEALWSQADGQYARLVAADAGWPANEHPVKLAPTRIAKALGRLELFGTGVLGLFDAADVRTTPVFVRSEIEILAVQLARGLERARPEQDLVFAVVGMHPGPISKERQIVAGRVFMHQRRLNVIFGDMHRPFAQGPEKDVRGLNVDVDRRLYPFVPGSRSTSVDHKWRLVPGAGMTYAQTPAGTRDDWIEIDLAMTEQDRGSEQNNGVQAPTPVPAVTSSPNRTPREEPLPTSKRSIKERLRTLEELRREGLIDEHELRVKRRQILEEL